MKSSALGARGYFFREIERGGRNLDKEFSKITSLSHTEVHVLRAWANFSPFDGAENCWLSQ